jgi:hypothetical protein
MLSISDAQHSQNIQKFLNLLTRLCLAEPAQLPSALAQTLLFLSCWNRSV